MSTETPTPAAPIAAEVPNTPPAAPETAAVPPYIIPAANLPQALRDQGYEFGVRTNSGCYGMRRSPMWGRRLVRIEDPMAIALAEDQLKSFELTPNFPRIPPEIWVRVVKLYFHFCDPNNKTVDTVTEVSVRFTRNRNNPALWRCWVPRQEVGAGSVHARFDTGMVDIVTGEMIPAGGVWPPEDEFDAGSSHSHNTMSAFFSGTDDANELGCPGIHAVVGNIDIKNKKYVVLVSMVMDGKRYIMKNDDPAKSLIDTSVRTGVAFHPNVLELVTRYTPKAWSAGQQGSGHTSQYPSTEPEELVVYDEKGTRRRVEMSQISLVGVSKNTPEIGSGPGAGASVATPPKEPVDPRSATFKTLLTSVAPGQIAAAQRRLEVLLKHMSSTDIGRAAAYRTFSKYFSPQA